MNRRTHEHAGACPFCGGDGQRSDRFRVWLEVGNERYWCRACNAKGPLRNLLGDRPRRLPIAHQRPRVCANSVVATPTQQAQYRQLYTAITLWAQANLLDPANPEPIAYLHQRGLHDTQIAQALLGVTRHDPTALCAMLQADYPALLPFAVAAGVLIHDQNGALRTHPNLCSCLLFPYLANNEVVDLRTRSYPGKGYRSLAGGYGERGAVFPFGWDSLDGADTVLITEGEIKALLAQQAYAVGRLSAPTMAHPGLSYLRPEWGAQLLARGVRTVVLAYDSQPRPVKDGLLQLAPEEIWSLRHGQTLAAAGLAVHVLRLPLGPGAAKADLDEFLLAHGTARLQHLLDSAPRLDTYQRSLPAALLAQAKLTPANHYPLRRARPQRLANRSGVETTKPATIDLATARAQIAELVCDHASSGQGMLVLAHPPGTGKGHNTVAGLHAYIHSAAAPGQIVWTALRNDQLADQQGLPLIPLHGRNAGNCHKFGEAQALAARGYSVHAALCQRRCNAVSNCAYLRQFSQEGDLFAPQPLLQATSWWEQASVMVLDEFDPARLTNTVQLSSSDLARMNHASACPHARAVLRWLSLLLGNSADRSLAGVLLISELLAIAQAEQLELGTTLRAAVAALPDDDQINMLPGLPNGAGLADYAALPPNYLSILLNRLAHEYARYRSGVAFTSRLEVGGGQLSLFLRREHLITQLARADQPKLILDATANPALLALLFPNTPLRVEQPRIAGGATIRQVISRDWAKTTLRGARRAQWHAAVAAQIRPNRPTLVVCTLGCESDLRSALQARGHTLVTVDHYGGLRGSNAYKGHDVILAQVYNPNLAAIVREGRALFADDRMPLDEQVVTTDRTICDANGATWVVQVPTFGDARLAALLEQHRESELVQAALRGRPFDYPDTQITMLFGLPLPQLPPTEILEDSGAPTSNAGRHNVAREALVAAATRLLDGGRRVVAVDDLAEATGASVATVRKHLAAVAGRLGLRVISQRRMRPLPQGGQRVYERAVLVRRGRSAPSAAAPALPADETRQGTDQARNRYYITRLIYRRLARPARHPRRGYRNGVRWKPPKIAMPLRQRQEPDDLALA